MSEQELIQQAREQGATHYSKARGSFWRKGKNGLEICHITNGKLGEWQSDWRVTPSESSERI